jgi:hypothetical protein
MTPQEQAEKAFRDWYLQHGADWNAAHIKPVFMAAWAMAAKASAMNFSPAVSVACGQIEAGNPNAAGKILAALANDLATYAR